MTECDTVLCFYRATPCYSMVYAVTLCQSVCLSVTSRSSTETAKHKTT